MKRNTKVNLIAILILVVGACGPGLLWATGSIAFAGEAISIWVFLQITVFWCLFVFFCIFMFHVVDELLP